MSERQSHRDSLVTIFILFLACLALTTEVQGQAFQRSALNASEVAFTLAARPSRHFPAPPASGAEIARPAQTCGSQQGNLLVGPSTNPTATGALCSSVDPNVLTFCTSLGGGAPITACLYFSSDPTQYDAQIQKVRTTPAE